MRLASLSAIAGIAALGAAPLPANADPFEQFGTGMKYALPLAAAVCAEREDRLEDFAVRGLSHVAVTYVMKRALDGRPISLRPNGEGLGFPSGHSAAAFFGAADLAGKCFEDNTAAGAAAYGTAGLAAWSRVQARAHNPHQVMAGALIGFSFGAADFGIGTDGASFSIGLGF
ncbi:phosphatase PAP2 family protein [Paracoccus sediminicola]|uniref:phosphatase PAP2 family protein n=1 Tax=Paracoccus sediminicola TaxID=3017783 RepID=UPI0022F0B244|nr:phosphatase PAP2 family protein [Paracoccus sediminicola]WBU57997.1 phosphatase PAP2 family protein [Paracoccus sediminicola]